MCKILVIIVSLISFNIFAATGMEKGTPAEQENYLYKPLNHMQTHISAGLTYFKLGGETDSNAKPGIRLGVNAEIGQGLVYMIGVNYLMLKSEDEQDNLPIVEYQLDYLSLILGAKYYLAGSNSGFYIRGNLDPSIAINTSVKNSDTTIDDFDVLAGVGIGFTFNGSINFNLDAGYSSGIMDISNTDTSANNQGLTVSLGLMF